MLIQQTANYVHYEVQYKIISSIKNIIKLNQDILACKWCNEYTYQMIISQNMSFCDTWIFFEN